jgi:hypothetical protein
LAVDFAAFARDADGCRVSCLRMPVRGELMDSVVIIVLALIVGLWAGGSFARFKRARSDLRGTKGLLPGLRKKRMAAGVHSLRAGALLVLLFVFFLGLRAAGKL